MFFAIVFIMSHPGCVSIFKIIIAGLLFGRDFLAGKIPCAYMNATS